MAEITLTITMKETEWIEAVNAISSKSASVKRGDYGSDNDNKRWLVDLKGAYQALTAALTKQGVGY